MTRSTTVPGMMLNFSCAGHARAHTQLLQVSGAQLSRGGTEAR